jgi:hypothetical protein
MLNETVTDAAEVISVQTTSVDAYLLEQRVSQQTNGLHMNKHSLVCCVTRSSNSCQVTCQAKFVCSWVLKIIVCILKECSRQTAFQ